MPCMCGDIRCSSCGPAQGNFRCIACGTWADEGCPCTEAEIAAAAQREREADEAYYQQTLELEAAGREYFGPEE